MIVCSTGCCRGCGYCYGSRLGCHQVPCRCAGRTCVCDYGADPPAAPDGGCEVHDDTGDRRCRAWVPRGAWKQRMDDGTLWRGRYQEPCSKLAPRGSAHFCHWHRDDPATAKAARLLDEALA